jgi:phage tail sheath protein FI
MRDTLSGNNTVLEAPPSVAAIGAIAKSDSVSHPWFAPAGFNRGGLARLGGSSGPAVIGTSLHLTKADRDTLYDAKVNPIAKFPSTGDTVIFGQKTLQQATSALDRINVRRLMIYLKRQIGVIADTILFDQNVQVTWNRFIARAEAVLSSVQAELGITEYKLVLDETTTTPDLIDRNILYAKIFVRPARSIEFIAIDFIITRTGVEF